MYPELVSQVNSFVSRIENIISSKKKENDKISEIQRQLNAFTEFSNHPLFIELSVNTGNYESIINRVNDEIQSMLSVVSLPEIQNLNSIGSNYLLLMELLHLRSVNDQSLSNEELLRYNGLVEQHRMLEENGGLYSTKEVSTILGLKPQSITDKRSRGELLAIQQGGKWKYPAFQFEGSNVIKGLSQVTKILNQNDEDMFWDACLFLLNPHDALMGEDLSEVTPLDAIKEGRGQFVQSLAMSRFDLAGN